MDLLALVTLIMEAGNFLLEGRKLFSVFSKGKRAREAAARLKLQEARQRQQVLQVQIELAKQQQALAAQTIQMLEQSMANLEQSIRDLAEMLGERADKK